ncbi:glycerol-3-phosphate 1-O-acyltransferase PlsY [bacterium]|nr:glycerol-3-phosphate 1-O-acyltransferase PlsY [bacterium]
MIIVTLKIIGILLVSYGIGSIPFAYVYGKIRGVDIRTQGSGNPGATNIMRVFGVFSGILVLLADAAKGYLAVVIIAGWAVTGNPDLLKVACGLAAIMGHTFTFFLRFKGGKGVATTCGVFLGLAPLATLLVLIPFVVVVALTRYISAGSLVAALSFPAIIWFVGETGHQYLFFYVSVLSALMIVLKHRANIGRIVKGTENKFGQKVKVSSK